MPSLQDYQRGYSVRYLDGLGDRNRSLSPEGDEVWNVLESTLTPDPQPPSVGSSFASVTTSATTSQNTSVNSSANLSANTSVTSPDGDPDQPCDHELDDTADEEGTDEAPVRRFGPPRPTNSFGRRTYAHVTAEEMPEFIFPSTGDDAPPEWLSGFQDIVGRLASRQDIPEEWWAQAGLSRSVRYNDF